MEIKLLSEYAQIPTLGSEWAAGYDLYAAIPHTVINDEIRYKGMVEIPPHETRLLPTGIALAIPHGYWGGIYARSGLATKQGLRPANCVGVVDSDYRGEILVALHNDTNDYRYVYSGDRIAQLILHESLRPLDGFVVVDELDATLRGEGGFGSTDNNEITE